MSALLIAHTGIELHPYFFIFVHLGSLGGNTCYSEEVSSGTQPETPFDFFDWFLELWRSVGRTGLFGTGQCFLPWMLCFHGDVVRMLLWGNGVLSESAIVHVGLLEARQVVY